MAKNGKKTEYNKEQAFDELLQNSWYYNQVYIYLLRFENVFTDISLMDFIINCEQSTGYVLIALLNETNNKDLTINYIIDKRGYYETSIKPDYFTTYELNDFELYLTKYIVAHCIKTAYKEDKKRTDYFNRVLAITESKKGRFKLSVNNYSDLFNINDLEMGNVFDEWQLLINENIKQDTEKRNKANTKFQIPTDLLDKLEQGGFIQKEPLQWLKSKSLLAYFVDVANDKLNLKHGQKRSIKPFEDMFNVSGLTGCMNEYKNKTGQLPQGYEDVDKLFE